MAIYGDYGYDNFLAISTIGTTITNLNADQKIASNSIDSDKLENDVIVKSLRTAKEGVRTAIIGNDMYLYDDTTGGSSPVSGDSANIFFPRTDDETKRFLMTKRSGVNHDNENVMEMYYDTDPGSGGKNYVFLGLKGDWSSSSDYHTDIIANCVDELFGVSNSNNTVSYGISVWNSKYLSTGFNSGGTRIALVASQCTSDSGYSDGAYVALGISANNSGVYDAKFLVDKNGNFLGDNLYPAADNVLNLGSSSLKFNNIYSTQYYVGGTYKLTVSGSDLYWNGAKVFTGTPSSGISWSTPVNANIVPASDGTYNLGSSTYGFNNLYIDSINVASGTNIVLNNTIAAGFAGTHSIGTSGGYFNEVHCASVVDHSMADLGSQIELNDGRIVTHLEALKNITVSNIDEKVKGKKTGRKYLDKTSFPKDVFVPAEGEGGTDGINMTHLTTIIVTAIKELDAKIENLQTQINNLNK